MRKKIVYIASPYAIGNQAENVRRSLLAAEDLIFEEFIPFCPLLTHFWHFMSPHPVEYWMDYDAHWLKQCDALLRLSGESAGADREEKWARQFGIPRFYNMEDLTRWRDSENDH